LRRITLPVAVILNRFLTICLDLTLVFLVIFVTSWF
jgi:hypothetical protein